MMQIEKQREDYYRKLGTPPGVPTMKGATAEPENTHEGYNTIIKELGDHSVPDGWIQRPKRNAVPDTPPGPPLQWDKAEDPDDVQPGYGYVPADTAREDIFYYHTDHLGSTSYITDAKANVAQFDAYLPYGELLVDEHSSSEEMPYKFNGKEFDEETGLYYYGARYMNPRTSLWLNIDRITEKYPSISGYVFCKNRPLNVLDLSGDTTVVQVSGYGVKRNGHVQYETSVYRNMSAEKFHELKNGGNLPAADYKTFLARDAHDITSQGKIIKHSTKRYGKNNETPPGQYYLESRGKNGGQYLIYITDTPGQRVIHGPDGDRGGIAIHQYSPNDSQGCLTTCSGKNLQPVKDFIEAIPDLKGGNGPVIIILEPREVSTSKYSNPANGSIKYNGVEHTFEGGVLKGVTITKQRKK